MKNDLIEVFERLRDRELILAQLCEARGDESGARAHGQAAMRFDDEAERLLEGVPATLCADAETALQNVEVSGAMTALRDEFLQRAQELGRCGALAAGAMFEGAARKLEIARGELEAA